MERVAITNLEATHAGQEAPVEVDRDDRAEVVALLASGTVDDLAEAARALGRDLAHQRHAAIDQVRRGLDVLARGDDRFAQGYAHALEQVSSGFAVAGDEAGELAPILRTVALRTGWQKVMAAMEIGATRPSDVVARTGLSGGRVSHVLKGLERVGLVERPPSAGDAREHPCRLSALGWRVMAELPTAGAQHRASAGAAADLDGAVVATTYMLAKLFARGRATRATLEDALAEHLERPVVSRVADAALRAARHAGLAVVSSDEAVSLAEIHLQDVINDALENAFDPEGPAVPVIDLARSRAPAGGLVVVRSEVNRLRWDIVIARRRFDNLRLVASADWLTGDVDRLIDSDRPFVMVYDSPPLARAERVSNSPARDLQTRADGVYCYAVSGTMLPEGVQAIEVA